MKTKISIAFFVSFSLIFSGCASKREDSVVIASVNGEQIYLKALKREISISARQNPSLEINKETLDSLVDMLVKRQLIIQEAMKRKMAEEEAFVDTIKAFWEQTLIRDFIAYKNREFDAYVFVTDKEVEDFYNKLKEENPDVPPLDEITDRVRMEIARIKKTQKMGDWLEDKKKKSEIRIDKNVIYREAAK